MQNEAYTIFDPQIGLDPWLRKGAFDSSLPAESITGLSGSGGLVGGGTSLVNNSVSDAVPSTAISGGELTVTLSQGKKSFTDTTAGYIMGLDKDGTYKWLIGSSTSSIDWNVTTSGVLTITGSLSATSGTIGGWTINSTTLTGGSTTLDSTGVITLGTSNNVVILSSVDATYRLWVGNATAASAPFSVTKAGAILSTSGTIGGFTLASTTITSTGLTLASGTTAYLSFGATPPSSPTAGTGIYMDKTALVGLASNVQTFKIDAATGVVTASNINLTSTVQLQGVSTNITGTELETLSSASTSNASALHYHAGSMKAGQTTQAINVTTTITIAHGLGVIPSMIQIYCSAYIGDGVTGVYVGSSFGTYDGTNNSCTYALLEGSTANTRQVGQSGTYIIKLRNAAGDALYQVSAAFDSTNITLTVADNTNTGDARNIQWIAFK